MGITTEAAEEYDEALENIFVDNPQAQFTEIAEAIALTERALDGLTGDELENVANTALKIEQQFGEDLQGTIGATEQLIEQFGLTSQQATDLLTFGLQNIPAEDLIDTVSEYSNQFAQAGFSANQFFSLLASGTAGGVLGTDKAADAVKEFQIRFLEGNKGLQESFGVLGLSFEQLTAQVDSGQASVADVFGLVVDRAGQVDLSIASNRAAIAGLGTQFEDLGAQAVAALNTDAIGFDDVAGAAETLDARFNNIGDSLTSLQRSFLVAIAPLGETLLESLRPAVSVFTERVIPAFEFAGEALQRLINSLGLASSSSTAFEGGLNAVASVIEGVAGGIEILARVTETFRQVFAFARAGAAAFGSIISDVFSTALNSVSALGTAFSKFVKLDFSGAGEALSEIEIFDIGASLEKAEQAAVTKFKEIAIPPVEVPVEVTAPTSPAEQIEADTFAEPFVAQSEAIEETVQNLDDYKGAIEQAESLQQSFAQEAEDAALKIARANEDIAKSQARDVSKLQDSQAKDRDKLLRNQQKELDKFESDRKKQIAKAESDIAKERKAAADQRLRDQQKLQRELSQAQERFNLSQLQSERRFKLSESRLIAEGDILALQQLREDQALSRQEEKENFSISQKERVQSAEETQRDQAADLETRLSELKSNLEAERAELLQSFDEQLAEQQRTQAEARALQQQKFAEDAEDRQVALAREEEDRRISQERQLQDLGKSFADQQSITADGTQRIAGEIEKVFGQEGVADTIFSGFKERTESDFRNLFENIQDTAASTNVSTPSVSMSSSGGFGGRRRGGLQEFDEGGVVGGPVGSPQTIIAHGGETLLPTHRSSFTMAAPVIPSQNLNVNMSGGFNISGDGQADEAILQAATAEMTENFRLAIQRVARRN